MKAGIALGSNREPRLANLQAARRRILKLATANSPIPASKVYETAPVGCPQGSPAFLNAVLELTTDLPPHALLASLQEIEIALGRPKIHAKNSQRSIDLDLLYCDDMTLCDKDKDLILPHPRMAERRFVLQPLSDIRPNLTLPNHKQTVAELLKSLPCDDFISLYSHAIY